MNRLGIKPRIRIYLGCEGQSEQSYIKWLGDIANDFGLYLHFDNDLLQPGGGDPLALVETAVRRIQERSRKYGAFAHRAILLDADKRGNSQVRDGKIPALAKRNGIDLLWQIPNHEAFLLWHLPESRNQRPATSALAHAALKREWPEYSKPMNALQLRSKITGDSLRRACDSAPEFHAFLMRLGFWVTNGDNPASRSGLS